MLFSVEQAFVGREEIRAPLKTPAWEAIAGLACVAGVERGRGRGNLSARESVWGVRGGKERNACKDAIVLSKSPLI